MQINKEWIEELCRKYGIKPKQIRDVLWPNSKKKQLGYFNYTKNPGVDYVEKIADVLNCSVDELLRRPLYRTQQITGDNNQVGNVNINNDVESLNMIIRSQSQVIAHQDEEIDRLNHQLKTKDQQIDRLIKLAQGVEK
jgi:peptidoglycan hydrolase CwlO-like protein